MVSRNDITGDKIRTKGTFSKQGEDNFDAIFRKNKVVTTNATPDKPVQLDSFFDEERIDIIGSNGNDGLGYKE